LPKVILPTSSCANTTTRLALSVNRSNTRLPSVSRPAPGPAAPPVPISSRVYP
jgi:hypothetical protein